MIVRELIEWLKTQDQEATVETLEGTAAKAWEGDSYSWVELTVNKHTEYSDMRGNPFAKGKPYENSRTLYLGEKA